MHGHGTYTFAKKKEGREKVLRGLFENNVYSTCRCELLEGYFRTTNLIHFTFVLQWAGTQMQ